MTKHLPLKVALFLFAMCCCITAYTQLPDCDHIYLKVTDSGIYNYNPKLPVSATNPVKNTITFPADFGGLTLSTVLGSGNAMLTFYCVDYFNSGNYVYYDPATNEWINTGHSTGNKSAVNLAAGGPYIFSLVGATGEVYRYDGTGPGVLIATVPDFIDGVPYDLVTDCEGNWYILNLRSGKSFLKKYNAEGTLLHSWVVYNPKGLIVSPAAGFAIIGNTLYTDNTEGGGGITTYFMGKDTLEVLSTIKDASLLVGDDLGCCAGNVPTRPEIAITATKTSLCSGGEPVSFSANSLAGGFDPAYQWLVNGVPVGPDSTRFTYTPANGDKVVCEMTSNSPCASPPMVSSDTIRMVVYDELPQPPTVISPVNYCRGAIAAPLTATKTIAASRLYWYAAATGGTASLSAPIPSTDTLGTFTYYVSEGDGACESTRIPISVIVSEVIMSELTFAHPASYGGVEGFIKFKTNKAHEVYKVNYYKNNVLQPELMLTSDASGYIIISDLGDGIYTAISITNPVGCASTAFAGPVELGFCNPDHVPMPNSFTPNGDNINDVFYVRGTGFTVKNFSIYNRLGNLVFKKENFTPNDPQYGWDGAINGRMISETAGFVYMLETICRGTNTTLLTKGTVLMIR